MHVSLFDVAFTLLSLLTAAITAAPTPRQTVCNGFANLCDRQYSNVTFIGSHDSAFVGYLPTENQHNSLAQQLSNGVRFLQGQTHSLNNQLYLCHTSCWEEDAGSLTNYLSTVKSFLDANPTEVVSILLTNCDNVPVSEFDSAFTSTGIKEYAFVPSTSPQTLPIGQWPTLGQLIAANTRLVVFLDYGANEQQVPYILNEFNYFFETPFDTTDPKFGQCSVNRPPGASPDGRMYIVNHFLDFSLFGLLIPDAYAASNTNAASGNPSSIGNQVNQCVSNYGRYPNVVLVDYEDKGNPMVAEQSYDDLSSTPTK